MSGFASPIHKLRKAIIIVIAILLVAFLVFLLIKAQPPVGFYITMAMLGFVGSLLWFGTRLISTKLDVFLPWREYVTSRFFIQLGLTIVYSLLCLNISYAAFKSIFTDDPPLWEQIIVMNIYGSLLILPIFSIYFGIHFLKAWKKSELESEQLQKESIKSQLDALKNHLDPHFLFNNLNILSSLIDKDTSQSKRFLEKFADVYRNILQNEASELISLKNELEFIDSYLYLISIRFQEGIVVSIDIDESLKNRVIPPLSLQMLLENCFKHNAISETKSLKINITNEGDNYLTVTNVLNLKKKSLDSRSSGIENIKKRYAYFTDLQVVVNKTKDEFQVKIPLLEIE